MENVNLDAAYFSSQKARRLRARLGPEGDVYPIRLWCHCANVLKNECLRDLLPGEIEEIVLWKGKAGVLFAVLASEDVRAVQQVKCDAITNTHYHARNFNERNGHILTFHARAKRAAEARWGKEKR